MPTQHQLGASLVVELRGDVQALRLGELVTRVTADGTVADSYLSEHQRKFAPMYFFPCRLHVSDSLLGKC